MLATFLDVAPEPVSIGVALAVVLFVIAMVILLAGALVFFLWYCKRSLRHHEMVRSDSPALERVQVNNPNQP